MAKLYFKYGTMGSSKTAQALMCKFNYEQKGFKVLLIKPLIDNRDMQDGQIVARSRIGLSSPCFTFGVERNLCDFVADKTKDWSDFVVIVDEVQFCTEEQVNQLHKVSEKVPVLCYGLLTNFKTKLFAGSKRLVEIAESIEEIKSVCTCGQKASINARFIDGELVTEGAEIMIGADESYQCLCFSCYQKLKDKLINN